MKKMILLIMLMIPALGNTYDDAKKAEKNKDYILSAKLYKKACDTHNDKACFNLGIQYLEGQGIPKNEKIAQNLFRHLCKKNVAKACHSLGYMYANNIGTSKDIIKAFSLYKKGCDLKDYEACTSMGTQYFEEKDYSRALKYYTIASGHGDGAADHGLGALYYKGYGVQLNENKAIEYYKKACMNKKYSVSFASCSIVGATYIEEKKYADAKVYLKKACDADKDLVLLAKNTKHDINDFENAVSNSCANLATLYYKGFGVSKDLKKSFEYMKQSAELENAITQHRVAQMYMNGIGVNRDYGKTIVWLEKSVAQGNANAQYDLGVMHYNGYGVREDKNMALKLYKQAAEQGNMPAQANLSLMYVNKRNYVEAVKWFKKAAEQGHAGSQINLGAAYCQGVGTDRNMNKCFYWVKKAKENGFDVTETWNRYELWRYE